MYRPLDLCHKILTLILWRSRGTSEQSVFMHRVHRTAHTGILYWEGAEVATAGCMVQDRLLAAFSRGSFSLHVHSRAHRHNPLRGKCLGVSGLSLLVKYDSTCSSSLRGRWVQRGQGLCLRRHKTHHCIRSAYGPPNLRLFPACPGTHRETLINSREICRQPSSWGCWKPGRPPEPFPLSCPPFSPAFTPALRRCQQAPHPRAERNAWVSARPAVLREDSFGGAGQGGGPGETVAASAPGRGPPRGSSGSGRAACGGPAGLLGELGSRRPATGTSHRGPRGRTARGGGGGGGGGGGRDPGERRSVTGLGAAVDGF